MTEYCFYFFQEKYALIGFCSMWGFLRGRVAGPAHNPPPFASWAWDQAMAELCATEHEED